MSQQQQRIHRFAIVAELGSQNGVRRYSAAPANSADLWILLVWPPPAGAPADLATTFMKTAADWRAEGVEAFAYKGEFCLASRNADMLDAKIEQLRETGLAPVPVAGPARVKPAPVAEVIPPEPPPPPPPPEPVKAPVTVAPPPGPPQELIHLRSRVNDLRNAMENWRRVAPRSAERELGAEAADLWELNERLSTARAFDAADNDRLVQSARAMATKILVAADESIDPQRSRPDVQNSLTQAVHSAGLALVDPKLNGPPAGAYVFPDAIVNTDVRQAGLVAEVVCRGLQAGDEVVQRARVRVWKAPPLPPEQPKPEPERAPAAKSSWRKWAGLTGFLGIGLFASKYYLVRATVPPPHADAPPKTISRPVAANTTRPAAGGQGYFQDPKSGVHFTYPKAHLNRVPTAAADEVVRLKSPEGVLVSVTVRPTLVDDRGEALQASYSRDLAVAGRHVSYQSGIKLGWYVVSGTEGSLLFYRRVLNPPGYIAAMMISHDRDLQPSFNAALVVAQTFRPAAAR